MPNSLVLVSKDIKLLWEFLSQTRRRQLLLLQILSVFAAIGEVANIGALFPFLGLLANPARGFNLLGKYGESLSKYSELHLLTALCFLFILVVLISSTLRILAIRYQLRLSAMITADLGRKVLDAALHKSYLWHLNNNSSTILSYLATDVEVVSMTIQAILTLIPNFSITLFLGTALIALAPKSMLAISILLASFYYLVFLLTRSQLRRYGTVCVESSAQSMQIANEALGGIRDILLYRSQRFFLDSFYDTYIRSRLASSSINTRAQAPRYLIEGFTIILIVTLSLVLALNGLSIQQQLPLLGTLALGAYRFLQPFQQCFNSISLLQANHSSLIRLDSIIQNTQDSEITHIAKHIKTVKSDEFIIAFDNVSFEYPEANKSSINSLSLKIRPAESVALVGPTGSGKSTCCDLFLGLLIPTKGTITYGIHDLQNDENPLISWQKRVAHVPQSIYLSDDTFSANIAYGIPKHKIDHERVYKAAKSAQISDFINSTSHGYNTVVGERGIKLSGGQRQRIGIARALYRQAEVLVLDEATSALDNVTESEVVNSIEYLNEGITIISIAHRLSTIRNCDRVYFIVAGHVVAEGTYKSLIATCESFRKFAQIEYAQDDHK